MLYWYSLFGGCGSVPGSSISFSPVPFPPTPQGGRVFVICTGLRHPNPPPTLFLKPFAILSVWLSVRNKSRVALVRRPPRDLLPSQSWVRRWSCLPFHSGMPFCVGAPISNSRGRVSRGSPLRRRLWRRSRRAPSITSSENLSCTLLTTLTTAMNHVEFGQSPRPLGGLGIHRHYRYRSCPHDASRRVAHVVVAHPALCILITLARCFQGGARSAR